MISTETLQRLATIERIERESAEIRRVFQPHVWPAIEIAKALDIEGAKQDDPRRVYAVSKEERETLRELGFDHIVGLRLIVK